MGTQNSAGINIECVVHCTSRMMVRYIESAKVMVVVLDFRTDCNRVPCSFEYSLDPIDRTTHRVQPAMLMATPRQGDIHLFTVQLFAQGILN